MSDADLGPLEPRYIVRRNDDTLAVVAVNPDGVLSIAPLISVPDPPRKRLLQCPCHCRQWFVMAEWPDGSVTLEPLVKPLDEEEPP